MNLKNLWVSTQVCSVQLHQKVEIVEDVESGLLLKTRCDCPRLCLNMSVMLKHHL